MKTIKASNMEKLQFLGNRFIAQALKVAAGILPVRDPKLLVGTSAIHELAACIAGYGAQKVLQLRFQRLLVVKARFSQRISGKAPSVFPSR